MTKIDHTKQCWNCKTLTMVPKGDYWRCSSCGSTWVRVAELSPPIIEYHRNPTYKLPRGGPPIIAGATESFKREVAKKRGA